jgi:hypothetical protein
VIQNCKKKKKKKKKKNLSNANLSILVTASRVTITNLFIPKPFAKSSWILGPVKVDNFAPKQTLENVDIGAKQSVGEYFPVLFSIRKRTDQMKIMKTNETS